MLQDGADPVVPRSDNTVTAEIPPTFIDEAGGASLLSLSDEETEGFTPKYPDTVGVPYTYSINDSERVSLSTGALIYETVDYVLPGVNGMDLVIGRRYNSQDAGLYTPGYKWDVSEDDYVSAAVFNDALDNMFALGQGWSFTFSYIQSGTLHLSDGSAYGIKVGLPSAFLYLDDYPLMDKRIEYQINGFEEMGNFSGYRLTHQDGTREYFSDKGKLLGIMDRHGSTISFDWSTRNRLPYVEITDTLGHKTVISCSATDSGRTVTVALPDGNELTYQVDRSDTYSRLYSLSQYTDPVGNTTRYSYTLQATSFNALIMSTSGVETLYSNLTTVTHPTLSQTVFTYESDERRLEDTGLMGVFKLSSREDRMGETVTNHVDYSWSENDCSGWPEFAASDSPAPKPDYIYSTTVTDSSGKVTTVTFNKDHLNTSVLVTDGTNTLRETLYEYNASKLPIKTTARQYNSDGAYLETIEAAEYDNKGNITAQWSSLANGDTANTEYKTTYTYDSTYGLPLTQTYKTNESTTVRVENTLDTDKKNIVTTAVYVNNTLTRKTDYTYDSFGNVTAQKQYRDMADLTDYTLTEYTYQSGAYLTQERHSGLVTADGVGAAATPGQESGTVAVSHTYDGMGRRLTTTDGNGNTTAYTYDALGNVTSVTNPDGTTVTYDRNYTANQVSVTDENGNTLIYTYTPLGQEYEIVDSLTNGVITRKEYDTCSRLSQVTDFVYGSVTRYTYDCLDRIISETVYHGETVLARTLYTYDDAAENGLYQKATKTVVGDANAPSIVTTQYTDRNGNAAKTGRVLNGTEYFDTATFDYVGNVLTTLTAADGEKGLEVSSRVVYNEASQIVTATNALGRSTNNTYDALGSLLQATDYVGTPTTYVYDNLGRLLSQTFTVEEGVTASTKYEYDPAGNLIREYKPTNAVGEAATWAKTEYTYDSRGRLTAVIQYEDEEVASVTRYTYDGVGNTLTMTTGLTSLTDAEGSTTAYTYDRFGNVLTTTDARGKTETNTYSSLGRLSSSTDRKGVVTAYAYDGLGRVRLITAGADRLQYTYTLTGQVRSEQSKWQLTAYTYDELGRVIRAEEGPAGEFEAVTSPTIEYTAPVCFITLDPNGGLLPAGAQAVMGVYEGGSMELPTPTRTGYTFSGWYLGAAAVDSDSVSLLTEDAVLTARWTANTYTIVYDPNIAGVSEEYPVVQTCTYDQDVTIAGEIYTKPIIYNYIYKLKDWWLNTPYGGTSYDFGETVRNLTAEPNGTVTFYGRWDVQAAITPPFIPNPTGVATVTDTDGSEAEGNAEVSYTYAKDYTYDLAGNRTAMEVYQPGTAIQSVTYTYDTLNRLSTVTENGILRATYTYDANGNRASLTYGNGVVENYQYNLANWITSLVNSMDGEVLSSYSYTYYASGSQKSETDHNGVVTSYTYDDLGRLTQESESGGQTLVYTYDANGNRLTLTASGEPVVDEGPDPVPDDPDEPGPGSFGTITFDSNGGMLFMGEEEVSLPVPEGYTLPIPTRMGYTFMGWYLGDTLITDENLGGITASCTLVAHWEEDEGGGIIIGPPLIGQTYTISYHANRGTGFMLPQTCLVDTQITLRENGFTNNGYRFLGWALSPAGEEVYQPGQVVSNLAGAGETITLYACWEADGIIPPIDPNPPGTETMTVTPSEEGGGCPSGQTEGETTTSYTTIYEYDANNRLISEVSNKSGNTVLTSYTYDDNGNLESQLDVDSSAAVHHSYNGFNQLVSSVTGEGTITYTYNAQGIRTSRTVGVLTTHYLLDGGNVIGEVEGDEIYTYVRGVNLIFGRARYYLYNAHGDVVQLTNTNGQLTKNYNYDAFGNERAPSEDDANPFRYCGEYYDTETGLYYLRARYYDPLIGRFTQEDTYRGNAKDPLSLNYYVYCYSNPVLYCDSGGHSPVSLLNRWFFKYHSYIFRYATRKGYLDEFLYATLGAENKGGTYHIRQDWWQSWSFVGYNRFYDFVFDLATDMETVQFDFTSSNTSFIIWAWKGDYLNLGAGAELGLYYGGGPHWKTGTDYALPMTLQLLDANGNVLVSWAPDEANWWITGFNPQQQYVAASTLTAIYTIDFSSTPDMFESFYAKWSVLDPRWTFDTGNLIATFTF